MSRGASTEVMIVSPHFDDAVLSCWSVLHRHGADACVLTVFGGAPRPGRLWSWDAGGPGAIDSATRMRQRREENRLALAVTGARSIDLDLLEIQYSDEGGGRITAEDLERYVRSPASVYVTAGIGRERVHPDHETVRDAVLRLRPDASLYADQPYCSFPADLGLAGERAGYRRQVVTLSPGEARSKMRAVACYAGEVLRMEMGDRLARPEVELRDEVLWHPAPLTVTRCA